MPVVLVAGVIVLALLFRPQAGTALVEKPKHVSILDKRVFPWLFAGFLMFFIFSGVSIIFGFTVQDRFNLNAQSTAGISAIYMTVLGLTMILGQAVIAPKLGWSSSKLLRVGLIILLVGLAAFWPLNSHPLLAVATVVMGLAVGLAMPGYNAGLTLTTSKEEQGAVAGIIYATNGLAYVVAPVLFTALYGWNHLAPFILSIAVIVLTCAYTLIHPTLRQ